MLNVGASILKRPVTRGRIFTGAFAGAILYCLFILIPNIWLPVKIVMGYFLLSIGMFIYTYHIKNMKDLFRAVVISYGVTVLTGGSISLLTKTVNTTLWKSEFVIPLVFTISWMIKKGTKIIRNQRSTSFCEVILEINGFTLKLRAFIDNGNSLVEPISQKPVSIVEKKAIPKDTIFLPEKYRVIPFHALGTDKGILNGYEVSSITIKKDEIKLYIKNPVIAVSEEYVSGKKDYQMILHPNLLKEREEFK